MYVCDGYHVKRELLIDPNVTTLQLIAYYDGVELVNKKHHVSLFYFMLGNIHPKKRSVYQAINLCKTRHLKQYGINAVLQPFIEDLKILGQPKGCSVVVDG